MALSGTVRWAAGLGFACIVYSCLGQEIDTDLDSLLTDENHAGPTKSLPSQIDTLTLQDKNAKSVINDTLPQHREISKSIEIDTIHPQQEITNPNSIDGPPPQQEMRKQNELAHPSHTEELPEKPALHNLAPFSSDRMHCIGASLDYFSYAEASGLGDIFVNDTPDSIVGTPKSTEYGLIFGLGYEGSIRKHGSQLLFRPKLEGQIGIHQTYDGSTQALPILNSTGDTIGFKFLPAIFSKRNYFAQAELDIGYCRTRTITPFYVYSGIKGNMWYRDMNADTISYSNQITNAELYYWFSVPIGLTISKPISQALALGFDASFNLMFFGQMKVYLSAWDASSTFTTTSPSVTLVDKVGFRLELPIMYKSENGNIFRIVPYLNLYSFGQSETETSKSYVNGVLTEGSEHSFYEPSSRSWLLGVKLQLTFLSPYTRSY